MPRLHCNNNTTYYHGHLVLYVVCMWLTVQYVLLSHCLNAISFMSLAPCYVPINCYVFKLFASCLFVCLLLHTYCFLFCVFCVFVLFCVLFLPCIQSFSFYLCTILLTFTTGWKPNCS
jgi:hypothetical protein